MSLFSKEKGIIFNLLNAVLLIWILSAIVMTVSNLTYLLVKDYAYTYSEYEISYCDFDYITKEECKNDYDSYMLDKKYEDVVYKRDTISSVSNVLLVAATLFLINKDKKKK